jgi:murein DD-endopeptidase MepM/ murein hydrolase activator NlpD
MSSAVPTGAIKTAGVAGRWEAITRHDAFIPEAADPVGWPMARVRAVIAIESAGDPRAMQRNPSNGDSFGLMQVVPYGNGWEGWHALVREKAGLPSNASRQRVIEALYDPRINIAVGVAILEGFYQQHGTLDEANSAFFLGNPFWDGEDTVNGNSGDWYRETLHALIREQEAFAPPDLIARIVSGARYTARFGFGMPNVDEKGVPQNFYAYGVGHGTDAPHEHTGIDINVPLGTTLLAPLAGVVRCVGNRGEGDWGQSCGSFPDTLTGGAGNVTIMTDAGLKLTFGHVSRPLVAVGDRVSAWQAVATSGGMIAPHVHLDASIEAPARVNRKIAINAGDYFLLDPIPAIAAALGQDLPAPPPTYADPLSIPQPEEFEVSVTVVATRDNVPVLQRADLASAPTNKPLARGDDFEALYQVLGNDRRVYWVSTRGSRVPVAGTHAPDWVVPAPEAGPGVDELVDDLEGIRADLAALSPTLAAAELALRRRIAEIGGTDAA